MNNSQKQIDHIVLQQSKRLNINAIQASSWLIKNWLVGFLFICVASFTSSTIADDEITFSDAQIAQILAPIALYPDTLLTHVLIASTYPIEVIEAERWRKAHSHLSDQQRQIEAEDKDWDASVKALLAFDTILTKLSEDLAWMRKLGDAFLQDEQRVLASIQQLRQQAEQAGSLAQMDNVDVIKEQKVIIIEPAQPEVIYVPYYDTRKVYGRWHWAHYPPVYWHNPYRYAYHHGPFYWDTGIHISFGFFFSAFHWHNHHIIVNRYDRHIYQPRHRIVTSHHAKRWQHKPEHRRGVAYNSAKLKHKYSSSRPSVASSKKVHLASNKIYANDKAVVKHKSNKYKAEKYSKNKPEKQVTSSQHSKFREKLAKQQSKQNNAVKNQPITHSDHNKVVDNKATRKNYRDKQSHNASYKAKHSAQDKHNTAPNSYQVKSTSVHDMASESPSYKATKKDKKSSVQKSYTRSSNNSHKVASRAKVRDQQR